MKIVGLALFCVSVVVQADVCSDLKNVADKVDSGFSDWLGTYDSTLNEYSASYNLPGAGECIINTGEFPEYECTWELSSDNQMNSQYQGLLAEIASCKGLFPEKMKIAKYSRGPRTTKYFKYQPSESSRFSSPSAPFEVSVGTRSSTKIRTGEQSYSINVGVSAM